MASDDAASDGRVSVLTLPSCEEEDKRSAVKTAKHPFRFRREDFSLASASVPFCSTFWACKKWKKLHWSHPYGMRKYMGVTLFYQATHP